MVWHEAPCYQFGMRSDISLHLLEEEIIVSFLKEDGFLVVATIVDVIETTFSKQHSSKIVKVSKTGV
jgi:hypothetical protein